MAGCNLAIFPRNVKQPHLGQDVRHFLAGFYKFLPHRFEFFTFLCNLTINVIGMISVDIQ